MAEGFSIYLGGNHIEIHSYDKFIILKEGLCSEFGKDSLVDHINEGHHEDYDDNIMQYIGDDESCSTLGTNVYDFYEGIIESIVEHGTIDLNPCKESKEGKLLASMENVVYNQKLASY